MLLMCMKMAQMAIAVYKNYSKLKRHKVHVLENTSIVNESNPIQIHNRSTIDNLYEERTSERRKNIRINPQQLQEGQIQQSSLFEGSSNTIMNFSANDQGPPLALRRSDKADSQKRKRSKSKKKRATELTSGLPAVNPSSKECVESAQANSFTMNFGQGNNISHQFIIEQSQINERHKIKYYSDSLYPKEQFSTSMEPKNRVQGVRNKEQQEHTNLKNLKKSCKRSEKSQSAVPKYY